ncbi:protein unc-50 homolog [Xenia sp. Carnegie-2017]|uniref:protein unc-50 homolog n=1 Tax=Xenia sp. Carnegie-2017 TaxID=2897299 RepID=UPI001F041AF1|nr:protein unc-50 homolog [Xenia sp. Carnegie-2017]
MSTKWLSSKNNFCCSRNKFARISTVCNMKVTISETSPNKNVSILCPNLSVSKRWKYFRRIFKYRQMDFEFALWQMLYLFISPSKVYRNFEYHKHTKHQWARDDPAFLVILSIWLSVSCIGFSIVLQLGFFAFIRFTLWVVFMEFVGVGLLVATILWFISNKYLRTRNAESKKQFVEWGYAFDVHLNAFFPLLVILHVIQLFFVKFLDHNHGFTILLCNTLWLVAFVYYGYITFLGYSALPFLQKTVVLLYPVPLLLVLYILTIVYSCNIGHEVLDFYKNVVR